MRHYKIVVTGPFAAGKTAFIKTITEITPIETEAPISNPDEASIKNETTVAMDFGRITIDNEYVLHVFGTPGQFRFSYMWSILARDTLGVIMLVSSIGTDMIEEAKDMLNFFRVKTDAPIVIALNHFNEKDIITKEQLKSLMGIPDEIPIVDCNATDKESVKQVLLKLLELILQNED